ncbi:MAG: cob(I)yrinic acid a,c-diamide adenosyltransferase [Thermodesulfobacteriota bacterium]
MNDATLQGKGNGLVLLYTGDGKGKSTAAFGQALRAAGHGLRVCIIQFIKGKWQTGEAKCFARLTDCVEFHVRGSGFTWTREDKAEAISTARAAFAFAEEKIMGNAFDMVVLDELTYLITYGMVSEEEVLELIRRRPRGLHLVITGRRASPGLLEEADLVSEIKMVKHHYTKGIAARPGIEF